MISKLNLENILFLDIETVPETQHFSDLDETKQALWDHKSKTGVPGAPLLSFRDINTQSGVAEAAFQAQTQFRRHNQSQAGENASTTICSEFQLQARSVQRMEESDIFVADCRP